MEILDLVGILEETVEGAFKIPFTNKCFVDKEELLESIRDINLKMPDEIKSAKWVMEEKQRIISDAQKEADEIIKNAAEKVNAMVNESEITRRANEEAMKIMEQTQTEARNLRMATKEYVSKTLNDLESTLNDTLRKVREDKSTL